MLRMDLIPTTSEHRCQSKNWHRALDPDPIIVYSIEVEMSYLMRYNDFIKQIVNQGEYEYAKATALFDEEGIYDFYVVDYDNKEIL